LDPNKEFVLVYIHFKINYLAFFGLHEHEKENIIQQINATPTTVRAK